MINDTVDNLVNFYMVHTQKNWETGQDVCFPMGPCCTLDSCSYHHVKNLGSVLEQDGPGEAETKQLSWGRPQPASCWSGNWQPFFTAALARISSGAQITAG